MRRVKFAILAISALAYFPVECLSQSQEQMDRINKNWGNIQKEHPNLNRQYKIGEIQKPGEIQVPRGIKAITQKTEECSHRFTVGSDTLFDFDKSTLSPKALETLNVLKPLITKLGAHPMKVEGHTDGKGTDAYNQTLSEKRAAAVKTWIVENKICPTASVTMEGFGKLRPVARNTNPDGSDNPPGRALNRRVEIVVDTCTKL